MITVLGEIVVVFMNENPYTILIVCMYYGQVYANCLCRECKLEQELSEMVYVSFIFC